MQPKDDSAAHPPSTPTRDDAAGLPPNIQITGPDGDGDFWLHVSQPMNGGTAFGYNLGAEFREIGRSLLNAAVASGIRRAAPSAAIEALTAASAAKDAEIARLTAQRDQWRNDCLDANISEGGLRARAERAEAALAESEAKLKQAVEAETRACAKICTRGDDRAAILAQIQPDPQHPDDEAVDRFADAMKAKLAKKRADGRGGWEGPTCSEALLSKLLRKHVEKGDPLDVGNLAMMLHQRGERIQPDPQPVDDSEAHAHEHQQGLMSEGDHPQPVTSEPVAWRCKACRNVGYLHCSDPENCGDMKQLTELESWLSWIDDLPLPVSFNEGKNRLQDFISVLAIAAPSSAPASELVAIPRYATDAMIDAGLYHLPADVSYADLHTAWGAMFDAVTLDGGMTSSAPAAPSSAPASVAEADGSGPTRAARDVLAERRRHISAEDWTPGHDDQHTGGEMAAAAAAYAFNAATYGRYYALDPIGFWPWDVSWWKPTNQRSDLVKAGALILAEIERLDRAALRANCGGGQSRDPRDLEFGRGTYRLRLFSNLPASRA